MPAKSPPIGSIWIYIGERMELGSPWKLGTVVSVVKNNGPNTIVKFISETPFANRHRYSYREVTSYIFGRSLKPLPPGRPGALLLSLLRTADER